MSPSVKKRDFKLSTTSAQSPGLTIQGILDEIPFVMPSAIVNRFALSMGGTVRAVLGIIAENFLLNQMIHSDAEYLAYDGSVTDAALTNFPEPSLDFYSAKGGLIEVGDALDATGTFFAIGTTPILGRDLEIDINHNYGEGTGFSGVLGGGQPQETDTGRVVTAVATIDFASGFDASDTFIQWQSDAKNGEKRAVRSRFFGVNGQGKKTMIEALIRSAELTEVPAVSSEDRATVPITLSYEAKAPEGATVPSEIEFSTWT